MSDIRVVITGLSAITPLGNTLETSWENLVAGKSGITQITHFDSSEFTSKVAGEVKDFDPTTHINPKQAKRMDRFTQFSVVAAKQLLEHANYTITDENAEDVGVLLGVGLGGIETIESFHSKLLSSGPNKVSPFSIPMLISNMAPGQVSIATGAKGTNVVMTSACASGAHAIGYAFLEIKAGRLKAAITGGAEATITPLGVSGFTALKALSTANNDSPEKASRPFEMNRDGFVMGEGAGLLLLEPLDEALKRGATIYGEVVGFGASGDAFHMTAPHEDGLGMAQAMKFAIKDAKIKAEEVDHINAHGTSTHLNDLCETKAIKKVFGNHAKNIAISANKSMMGHLLGAAGGVEAVFSTMALYTGIVPPTINYDTPDPECDLNYTPNKSVQANPKFALSNSFGFGGTNCSLLFKKWEG